MEKRKKQVDRVGKMLHRLSRGIVELQSSSDDIKKASRPYSLSSGLLVKTSNWGELKI